MRREAWWRALRPVPVLAVLGLTLAGCAGVDRWPGGARYGGYYGGPGYYGSPYAGYGYGPFGGYSPYYAARPYPYYYRGHDARQPRVERSTQALLRQHWINSSRRLR